MISKELVCLQSISQLYYKRVWFWSKSRRFYFWSELSEFKSAMQQSVRVVLFKIWALISGLRLISSDRDNIRGGVKAWNNVNMNNRDEWNCKSKARPPTYKYLNLEKIWFIFQIWFFNLLIDFKLKVCMN